MTQEDKELLIKDLCARLLYGVKGIITYDESNTTFIVEGLDNDVLHLSDAEECNAVDFKPYLRPMSSMTEEERKEYKHLVAFSGSPNGAANFVDWLNSHRFDYRGLIGRGLALEAPDSIYI